jgi:hypothetical protein
MQASDQKRCISESLYLPAHGERHAHPNYIPLVQDFKSYHGKSDTVGSSFPRMGTHRHRRNAHGGCAGERTVAEDLLSDRQQVTAVSCANKKAASIACRLGFVATPRLNSP